MRLCWVFCSDLGYFLFFYFYFLGAHEVDLLDCLFAEQPGQEM
jgi:hypothetical protein